MHVNLRLCIISAVWLCGSCQETQQTLHCQFGLFQRPGPMGVFEGHISVHVTLMSLTEQAISSGMRSQEEISAQLTGNPSYTDNMEGDCAKFCCLQRNSQGLQEGFRLQQAASFPSKCPTPKACEWKRETEHEMSWTICKTQKRSWPNIFPYGLDHSLSGGSSPERC